MNRSLLSLFFVFVACMSALAGEDGWSEPVNGLRGRLSFGKGEEFGGIQLPAVYLELENVSRLPIEIFYDTMHPPRFELTDNAGKAVPHQMADASIMVPPAWWFTLPFDSAFRFRVSVSGYGVMPRARMALQLPADFWEIDKGDSGVYFISATFTNAEPDLKSIDEIRARKKEHRFAWKGTLELPKIKVPINSGTAAE